MPDPTKPARAKSGIWLRSDMPNKLEYEVLCHLASNPGSRAYPGWYEVGLSMDETTGNPGWHRRGALHNLDSRWKKWIVLDRDFEKEQHKKIGELRPYRISEAGFEAIVQYEVMHRLDKVIPVYTRKLLNRYRKAARALKPK